MFSDLDNKPLISVVIPTYNRAHLVVDALESVVGQSYRPLQLILVDDGSSDDTDNVIADWRKVSSSCDIAFRYLKQHRKGGNAARNTGIEISEGECLAFLDSDDTWHPFKLIEQYRVLASNPDFGAVYCGVQHIDYETGTALNQPNHHFPEGDLLDKLLVRDVTAPTSTWLIRKEVFEAVGGFDTNLMARQDWDMWIRISSMYKIGAVPKALVYFREHAGPRTASDPQREIDAYATIMKKYAHVRETRPFIIRQSAKSAYHRRLGRVSLHYQRKRSRALAFYLVALVEWPLDFDNHAALIGWFLPKRLRAVFHRHWNKLLGSTILAIRSH